MEISVETGALLAVVAICCYVVSQRQSDKRKKGNTPPSLPTLPVVGSLPFLGNLSNIHNGLAEKSKIYGKIFSVQAGCRQMVVLNGYDLIREALIKNSSEYAGRGEVYVEKRVFPDHGRGVIMCPASDTQRRMRSGCMTVLKTFGFGSRAVMELKIQEEANHLIEHIRSHGSKPWHPSRILEQSTLNVIYNLMFGHRFSYDDEDGQKMSHLSNQIATSVDAVYDLFPVVLHLPSSKRKLAKSVEVYDKYIEFCEARVEENINDDDNNNSENNFVKEFIKLHPDMKDKKRDLAVLVRDLFLAGTETTSGQLSWACILLANHPKIQSRVQDEIDSAVPRDRLPSLDDKGKLLYLEAVIHEVFRLKTALPLGVPRYTLADTVIGGYDIPAGTEILANLWSAHMDPEVWTEPEKFNPDRFLDESGHLINRDLVITFSQGKRSCLGEVMARQEMFLFLSAIMQQFRLLPPSGEDKVKDEAVFIRTFFPVHHTIRFEPR